SDAMSWSVPALVPGTQKGFGPFLAANSTGRWELTWQAAQLSGLELVSTAIFSAHSADGLTWTLPVALSNPLFRRDAHEFDPRVTATGSAQWVAIWGIDNAIHNGVGQIPTYEDIVASRSADDGATWSTPTRISTTIPASGYNTVFNRNPWLASAPGGRVVAAW